MTGLSNILAVARREYAIRVRTRSFLFGTLVLLLSVAAIAFAPIVVRAIDQSTQQRIAVHLAATDLRTDPVATLTAIMNAPTDTGATTSDARPDYVISAVPDLAAARRAVISGDYAAALEIARASNGDLAFTLYTNDSSTGRTAGMIGQASTSIAISDRLGRLASRRSTRPASSPPRPSPSTGPTPLERIRPRPRRIWSDEASWPSG
jgi:ABC-type Na+ efflux pump permease subunit